MITTTLRKSRLALHRVSLVHKLARCLGLTRLGWSLYAACATRKDEISLDVGGQRLRFGLSCGRELARLESFDHEEAFVRQMLAALRPGDTIFDVGANIGVISLILAKSEPTVHVHAFEPEPRNAAALRRNVELNSLQERIHVHERALGADEGKANLYVDGEVGHGTHSLVAAQANGRQGVDVIVQTAASFCERMSVRPDVVKIDVEGAEGDVLAGFQPLLDHQAVRELFVEWHPGALEASGTSIEQVCEDRLVGHYRRSWRTGRGGECQERFTVQQPEPTGA